MGRRAALAATLSAGAVLATLTAVAAPAAADTTPGLSCEQVVGANVYRLTASADYTDSIATGLRTWTTFRFMVHGGDLDENQNNVNIRLSEYGSVKFTYNSPDSLQFNRWYGIRPDSPVQTVIGGPNNERDHRTNALIEIEGVFDRSGAPDPRCTATLKTR